MTESPPPPLEIDALVWGRPGVPFGGPWSVSLNAGDAVAVLGPNGAGKTTLFRTLIGAVPPLAGRVRWDGRLPGQATPAQLAASVAFVPQLGQGAAGLTAGEYVMLGRLARKAGFAGPGRADREAVTEALAHLGLDGLAERLLHRLSGGERQLVAIARALAQQARVLVLDEPTASLDFGNQARVLGHLESLAQEGFALLFSTHQPEHAQRLAPRVLAIDGQGHMRFGGSAEVLTGAALSEIYGVPVERIDRPGRDAAFVAGGRRPVAGPG